MGKLLRDGLLDELAATQCGIATRRQLAAAGVGAKTVDAQLAAERWLAVTPTTVMLANAPTSGDQLCWVAVLNSAQTCALASTTALQVHGMTGLVDDPIVHLVVGRDTMTSAVRGVRVHESRRFTSADVRRRRGLPVCSAERAAIDAAAWQRRPRYVYAVIAAVVQQRLGRVDRLREELDAAGQVRHRGHIRCAIADAEGGAQALSEIDLTRSCRRRGLVEPDRQRVRRDPFGRRRYLDAEWRTRRGQRIVLEVDGSHHLDVASWEDDLRRERSVVVDGARVVRCSAREIRLEPDLVLDDLERLGVPRV